MEPPVPIEDIPTRLAAQCAPASHFARIGALQALAAREPSLRAMALVGSYAKGTGDRVSDLDLVAIVDAGCVDRVLSHAQTVLRTDDVLNEFGGRRVSGGAFRKLVYLDFSSVEFHVVELGAGFRLRRPFLAVWDPHDLLPSLVADGEPIRHEDFAAYEYGDEGLLWELVDCIKWLSRGRHELAKRHIAKLAAQMASSGKPGGI